MHSVQLQSFRIVADSLVLEPALARAGAQALDAAMVRMGLPVLVLMENAARAIADVALHMVSEMPVSTIVIFCGRGNNGADGLAAARLLVLAGQRVMIVTHANATPDEQNPNPFSLHWRIAQRMEIPMIEPTGQPGLEALERLEPKMGLIIDAIVGTGPTALINAEVAAQIGVLNDMRSADPSRRTLCVDLPSGMDADTGESLGAVVVPDATVTFAAVKQGLQRSSLPTGQIYIANIGLPSKFILEHTTTQR